MVQPNVLMVDFLMQSNIYLAQVFSTTILPWLNAHKRLIQIGLSVVILLLLVKEALQFGDFRCYLEAARIISGGGDPYADWIQIHDDNYCQYFYSPLWALLLIPMTMLPQFIPNILWLSLSILFIYRTWHILLAYLPNSMRSGVNGFLIVAISLLLSIRFIQLDIALIQMTSFMLWASMESIYRMERQPILAAFILAFAINVKLLPLVVLAYMVYRGYWKTTAYVVVFLGVFILLPTVFLGWERNAVLLFSWMQQINPAQASFLVESELGPHSLTAWIPTLLMESEGSLPYKRNITNLSLDQVTWVLNGVRLSLILGTLVLLKWPPFKRSLDPQNTLREIAYILLMVPLIFPHQQKYAFVFIIPAAVYLSFYIVVHYTTSKGGSSTRLYGVLALVVLAFILMTLSTDGLIGRELNRITQHFKTITLGGLLLAIALLSASPPIDQIPNEKT